MNDQLKVPAAGEPEIDKSAVRIGPEPWEGEIKSGQLLLIINGSQKASWAFVKRLAMEQLKRMDRSAEGGSILIESDGVMMRRCDHRHIVGKLNKRIADLEAKLAACEWKPITADNMPKLGDECLGLDHITPEPFHYAVEPVTGWHIRNLNTPCDYYSHGRRGYFRAINPPQQGKP